MIPLTRRPELLAPVGDFERLEAAVRFGADAVYLGSTEFGMRAAAASFGLEDLEKAVSYAHGKGVRVYLTCNTLPRCDEIDRMEGFLQKAAACGVDAFIVTDLGVLSLLKEAVPGAEIHISTQTGVVNHKAAEALYRMGAKRVVLARELSLKEIRYIRANTPPDLSLEVFVHGAMCMSFSGRCVLSNYLTGRDANRGQCAQPCRWNYRLVEEKRPGEYYPIGEDEDGTYILNAKDLCMIDYLNQVIEAGADSLKIEGRAKSSYYVSVVTNAYRIALDRYLKDPAGFKADPALAEEVRKVSHRDYSTGFFFGRPENGQRYETAGYIRSWDVAAVVESWKDQTAVCIQKNRFFAGDQLELLEPGRLPRPFTVREIRDEDGLSLPDARHPHMRVFIPAGEPILPGSILRKQNGPTAGNQA